MENPGPICTPTQRTLPNRMALIANERVYFELLKMFNFLIEKMPSFREAIFYREVSHELSEKHEEWESRYEKEKMALKQLGNR